MKGFVALVLPETVLFLGTCAVMLIGLSPARRLRELSAVVACVALLIAAVLGLFSDTEALAAAGAPMPELVPYIKMLVGVIGILLVMLMTGTVDRREESLVALGRVAYNPLRTVRAEFFAFVLFSLTGVMLCASAPSLIWLFLALELTSLPTYVMVVLSGRAAEAGSKAQEAGVKYFFLGALGAAIFLYGFALIYGGTGATQFTDIAAVIQQDGLNSITTAGFLLALVGVSFKIAAVPMHFYTADVYEGASSGVSAFLAFAPKTAGIVSLIILASCLGWGFIPESGVSGAGQLPPAIDVLLWITAATTMTVGNVLAWLQSSVKRMLAYSSIAHSGYMLVGIIAGPGDGSLDSNGLAASLFYLLTYGVMNIGAFGVLGCLERGHDENGEPVEPETIDDLNGLRHTRPGMAIVMSLCCLSLLGLPPLLGFFGKLPLFTAGISAERIPLVLILGLNSAIAAFYYLRLVNAVLLAPKDEGAEDIEPAKLPFRGISAALSAGGVVTLVFAANPLLETVSRVLPPRAGIASPLDAATPSESEAVSGLEVRAVEPSTTEPT
ncbi:MAG: NADH-quinone oxidoreductase subunit N, partial [Planctomycetota bacterium]